MTALRLRDRASLVVSGLGVLLFAVALQHHAGELSSVDTLVGPAVGLLLDGVPALGLVYAGRWLAGTDLSRDERWLASTWCLSGAALFAAVMGVSLVVRAVEGRVVAEPAFPMLIATGTGGVAGFVGGYYNASARANTRRARRATGALTFVNDLVRHDLRNDLNVIRGHANLIEEDAAAGGSDPEPARAAVVVDKADEALERIETAGAVARTLAGRSTLEPVDLVAVVAPLVRRVEDSSRARVTTDLPARALVLADAGLRSVVDNLLENAVEHNDAADPRVHASVTLHAETVRLRISDNGPGIPDGQRASLFEAEPGESGGLSLVGTLVDSYDGEVWVEDDESRGSAVVVELGRATEANE